MTNKLRQYDEYRKSDLLWLDRIPRHWKLKKIKHLFKERTEKGYPDEPLLAATQAKGVVPKSMYENRTVTAEKDLHLLKLVEVGDFVISLRSFQGGIEYAYYRGIISPAYTIMVPNEAVNRGYFRYLAKSQPFLELLGFCVTGIREGQNIDYGILKNSYMPVPPLEEQEQIARYLDDRVSRINKFIGTKKKQIELLKELKNSVIYEVVTKGLEPTPKMKSSGVEGLGNIPEEWDIRYLFQITSQQTISNKEIQNQNLLSLSYGRIIQKDIDTTEGLLPSTFDTYQVVSDGNIILRLTDLQNDQKSLRVGLVTQTGIITSAYTCLSVKDYVLPEYLYLLLHSYDVKKVFYGMGSGVRQSMSYKDIKRLVVIIPPLKQQKRIVQFCNRVISNVDLKVASIEKKISLLSEFRTAHISQVVTGKIDVRGIETEEPVQFEEDLDEQYEGELESLEIEEGWEEE
jgi:type I restriction enzyme S subunit